MATTALGGFGEEDGQFAEPLAPIYDEIVIKTQQHINGLNGLPYNDYERVKRQDFTEDVLTRLDVSTWPQIRYWKSKYVVNDGRVTPPPFRVQKITRSNGEIVYALWIPVPGAIEADSIADIARAASVGIPVAGWNITYHAWDGHWCSCTQATYQHTPVGFFHADCGRLREPRNIGGVPNIQAVSDEEYCGFYPTIRGNDPAHWDPRKKGMEAWRGGDPIASADGTPALGREIRAGRREYREATKNYYEWDPGYQRDVDRIRAENEHARVQKLAEVADKANKLLPRKIGEV